MKKNHGTSVKNKLKLIVLSSFFLLEPSKSFAAACNYPNLQGCTVPADVAACLNPTNDTPCVGNKQGIYPLFNRSANKLVEGCYNDKFARIADLPASRSCAALPNSPIRVELYYQTICSDGRPTCLNGSDVSISPIIKADAVVGSIKMNLAEQSIQPVSLKNTSQTNASKSFCSSLYGNGYIYNSTTKQCDISVETQCSLLGMEFDVTNNKCISDLCSAADCTPAVTEKVCKGYTVNPSGKSCACKGTATILDGNGSRCDDCSGKSTTAPLKVQYATTSWSAGTTDTTGLGLVGYWRLNGNVNNEVPGGYALRDGSTLTGAEFSLYNNEPLRPVKFTTTDPLMGGAALFDGRGFLFVGKKATDSDLRQIGTKNGTPIYMPTGNESRTIGMWIYTEDRLSFGGFITDPNLTSSCNFVGRRQGTVFNMGRSWNAGSFSLELRSGPGYPYYSYAGCGQDGLPSTFGSFYNWGGSSAWGGIQVPHMSTIPSTGWYYITASWDSATKKGKFYINGVKIAENSDGKPLNSALAPLLLGVAEGGNNPDGNGGGHVWENGGIGKFFYGRMKEVALFNAALNDDQILNIYNKSKNGFCENPTIGTGGDTPLNLVIANELSRGAQESSVVVKDNVRGYSLTGYSGDLTTSVSHTTGLSDYKVTQPGKTTLNIDTKLLKGSASSVYVRVYNNAYDIQKAGTLGDSFEFADIPLNSFDKNLIIHVSSASIPKSDFARARVFFTRGGCSTGIFQLTVKDFDSNTKLTSTTPSSTYIRSFQNVAYDPHTTTNGVSGGFESSTPYNEYAFTFTGNGGRKSLNNFSWADINLDGSSFSGGRALNFSVTNASSGACNADLFMITNDKGYQRTEGLNQSTTKSYSNIMTSGRLGYSQNAHIVIGATAPAGTPPPSPTNTSKCYITKGTTIKLVSPASVTFSSTTYPGPTYGAGATFTATNLPVEVPCAKYDYSFTNPGPEYNTVRFNGGTGPIGADANCPQPDCLAANATTTCKNVDITNGFGGINATANWACP